MTKPSDFPRDLRFRDPTTKPFRDDDGIYHVFSFDHVMRVLRNREQLFTRDPTPRLPASAPIHMASHFMWVVEPFDLDGSDGRHTALRKVVEPWFKTRAVRTMEPIVRRIAVDLIDEIASRPERRANLARDLCSRMSMQVICALTGIELEREQWMRQMLDDFNTSRWDDRPPQWQVQAYFWRMVSRRLARPGDELLDVLVAAWRDAAITDDELLGYLYGFIAAGTDTTGTSLVNALAFLDEFELLEYAGGIVEDAPALARLVDEILRFGTPFPMKMLSVLRDTEFDGLEVPAGSVLAIWLSAANRDEAINAGADQSSPDEFDPGRSPNRHLALGWGRHHCLGAELAKLETRVLLQEALTRLPGLALDREAPFVRLAGIVDTVTEAHFTY